MSEKVLRWMPYQEYVAYKEWMDKTEPEVVNRMRYFFWNNFSFDGYEEWKLNYKNNEQKEETGNGESDSRSI